MIKKLKSLSEEEKKEYFEIAEILEKRLKNYDKNCMSMEEMFIKQPLPKEVGDF